MLPPLITSAVAHGESNALKNMADHLTITHKSKRLVAAARLYARVMMQGQQPFLLPQPGQSRDERNRSLSSNDLSLSGEEEKLMALRRAVAKSSVERTLSRMQPSREVIDGDINASYAIEGPN